MKSEQILPIGTMVRINTETVARLDFIREAGMECCQLCRIGNDYMLGDEGKAKTAILAESLYRNHLQMSSMFFYYPDMKWSDDECGITPEHHRTQRLLSSMRQIQWGKQFGARYFVCHAGKFPDENTPAYDRWLADMKEFCQLADTFDAAFLFETGPEPVHVLKNFLDALDEPNAGINFDPANLLIYNQTDPELFLKEAGHYVRAVHCKDAKRPQLQENTAKDAKDTSDAVGNKRILGKETALCQGDTHFRDRIRQLYAMGFRGPLIIEREILPGPEQDADVISAVNILKDLRAECLASAN